MHVFMLTVSSSCMYAYILFFHMGPFEGNGLEPSALVTSIKTHTIPQYNISLSLRD